MTTLPPNTVAVYAVADLVPDGYALARDPQRPEWVAVRTVTAGEWTGYGYAPAGGWQAQAGGWWQTYDHEPTVAELADAVQANFCRPRPPERYTSPERTFEAAGHFLRTVRLSADDLLADPTFSAAARAAAEKGKSFTADLLEYEAKPVVREAVARVRAVVDAERAAEQSRRDAEAAATAARLERERPTREAVLAAYGACGYRGCSQGHDVTVDVGLDASPAVHHTGRRLAAARATTHPGDRYSSRCTFRRTYSRHALFVPADWLTQVAGRGLSRWAGRLVLDAEPAGVTNAGELLLDLRTVRQGRGTDLAVEAVRVAGSGTAWRAVPAREKVSTCPAPILADYLADRDSPEAGLVAARA